MRVLHVSVVSATESSEDEQRKRKERRGAHQRGDAHTA